MARNTRKTDDLPDAEVARRRDEAVRRALNTPPKPHKDMKKGTSKKQEDEDHPTASCDGKRT
ncbi:MAG: hypothetical protein ABL907_24095 [Hyphomicrobium sp.]